jgi:hypothetical protein
MKITNLVANLMEHTQDLRPCLKRHAREYLYEVHNHSSLRTMVHLWLEEKLAKRVTMMFMLGILKQKPLDNTRTRTMTL